MDFLQENVIYLRQGVELLYNDQIIFEKELILEAHSQ